MILMSNRRSFIKRIALVASGVVMSQGRSLAQSSELKDGYPMVISTWNFGQKANESAWQQLQSNKNALDAVEQGVRHIESDASNASAGLGGMPDESGKVTLDACIMDWKGKCGSVAFLENIEHPISVARKVMEETNHVMLVGEGAYEFARAQGFEKKKLLTKSSKSRWKEIKQRKREIEKTGPDNHDTIGMLAIDQMGNLAGACTTSGLSYKLRGRVGDSPVIGAGLFVDNEVGAATATGMGEAIIRVAGCHTVVEMMRRGANPEEACMEAVNRFRRVHSNDLSFQAGFIAINKRGEWGDFD